MKLRINKAYDLSSISVLPPRRTGCTISSQGTSQQLRSQSQQSQLRSQSQQSFSQGTSQSQLSQYDEVSINDQRLSSSDNAPKAGPPFPSTSSCIRDESQMQLSRVAPSTVPRWNSSSSRDVKSHQVNEELDQRLRHVETVLCRLGMIIDSVQSDVMHISRAVKEVLLETDGIRQKIITTDNSLQQIAALNPEYVFWSKLNRTSAVNKLKGEENMKTFFDESLKNFSCELTKNSNSTKLNEISSQISDIPDQILANFTKLNNEIIRLFSRETEVIVSNIRSFSLRNRNPVQAPISKSGDDSKPLVKDLVAVTKVLAANPIGPISRPPDIKVEADKVNHYQRRRCQASLSKMKEPSVRQMPQKINFINLDSDEEKDGSPSGSCFILKKEMDDKDNCLMKEAMEDSMRILREARKRKRRQMRNLSMQGA